MTQTHGVAAEPPENPVVRALDVPAVGLVFVFAALLTLPQALNSFVQLFTLEGWDIPGELLGALVGTVAYVVFQLGVGLAVAWQHPLRRVLFVAQLAVGVVVAAFMWTLIRDELGVRTSIALVIELFGAPLLVVAAPHQFRLRRLHDTNALGGLLILYGVSSWISVPVGGFGQARSLAQFHAPLGAWVGMAIPFAMTLVIATTGLVAGLRMARQQAVGRALAVYVILAIGLPVVLAAVQVMFSALEDGDTVSVRARSFVTSSALIGLAVAVIKPLVVWFYAKRETSAAPVDGALPWIALWFAPYLLARCLMWDELMAFAGPSLGFTMIAVCLALGFVLILAARDSLHEPGVWHPWLVASGFAAVLLAVTVYLLQGEQLRHAAGVGAVATPITLLFATTATAAWLRRRVTSVQ